MGCCQGWCWLGSWLDSALLLWGYVYHRPCVPVPRAGDSLSVGFSSSSVQWEGGELQLLQAVECHVCRKPSVTSASYRQSPTHHMVCKAVTLSFL